MVLVWHESLMIRQIHQTSPCQTFLPYVNILRNIVQLMQLPLQILLTMPEGSYSQLRTYVLAMMIAMIKIECYIRISPQKPFNQLSSKKSFMFYVHGCNNKTVSPVINIRNKTDIHWIQDLLFRHKVYHACSYCKYNIG